MMEATLLVRAQIFKHPGALAHKLITCLPIPELYF
jgi:hypothetical protein